MSDDDKKGLEPMSHGQPALEYRSREREEERATRKPLDWWDRVKFLALLGTAFLVMTWGTMARFAPQIGFVDAVRETWRDYWWMLALAGAELIRQLHFVTSEHWAGYYRLWSQRIFGGFDRWTARWKDWTRFRISRVAKLLFFLAILSIVLGGILGRSPFTVLFELPFLLFSWLPYVFQLAFGFFFIMVQFLGLFWFLSKGGVDVYYPDDVKTRFTDVWGQDNVLDKIKENMVFLEEPEKIEEQGGYVPGGVLLWGPPGTGKTLMAEAVAGETGKPFVFVEPGAFMNMFFGVGILKVKGLFRRLRKLALRYGGVIAFFDEADSLGNRGMVGQPGPGGQPVGSTAFGSLCNGLSYLSPESAWQVLRAATEGGDAPEQPRRVVDRIMMGAGMGGGGMGTLQALLTEMSGLKKPRGFFNRIVRRWLGMRPKPPPKYRILIMMATNRPDVLDPALLRPGRLDRIYKVGYPSKAGRIRTYQGYLEKVRHELTDEQVDKLATITPYYAGANIKDIVNEALINAIRDGRETIQWKDVVKAKQLKDLGPPEDVEYIERERHAVAVHEACHAVAALRARQHLTIDIATIEKGGSYLGMVASIPPEDQFTRWRSEYEADIIVSLASLAGERLFFGGDSSSGVSGDLETATQLMTLMEGYWGMGGTVASHGVTHRVGIGGGGRPGQGEQKKKDLLQGGLGERIEERLHELYRRAEKLLRDNRAAVLAVAHALETRKTVTGDDIAAIVDGEEGPIVDGRPYGTAAFRRAAETYHKAAVLAHKEHRAPDVTLPDLGELGNGQRRASGGGRGNGRRSGNGRRAGTKRTGTRSSRKTK
ncbi:MAG TPA: AAA family ATPase [Actinomycetota bacterium]